MRSMKPWSAGIVLAYAAIILPVTYTPAGLRTETPFLPLSFVALAGWCGVLLIGALASPQRGTAADPPALITLAGLMALLPLVAAVNGSGRPFLTVYVWIAGAMGAMLLTLTLMPVREVLRAMSWAGALFGGISALVVVGVVMTGNYASVLGVDESGGTVRLAGMFGNPNRLGVVMALGLLCTANLVLNARSRPLQVALSVLGLPMLVLLLASGNRSGLLSLTVALAVLVAVGAVGRDLWSNLGRMLRRAWVGVALAVIVVIILTVVSGAQLTDAYVRQSGLNPGDDIRITLWRAAFRDLRMATPVEVLLGRGYRWVDDRYYGLHPHNGYLRFAIEYGLLFVSVFCWAVATALRSALGRPPVQAAFIASVFALVLVREMFTQDIFQIKVGGYVMAAFLVISCFRDGRGCPAEATEQLQPSRPERVDAS